MRSVVLVLLLAIVAAITGAVRFAEPEASVAAALPAAVPAPTAVMQEAPPVTVRVGQGRSGVKIGSGPPQGAGTKGRVENPGLGRDPERPGHVMLSVEGSAVSLANQGTSGEGLLTRIHVDADEGLTAVIGFYSTIAGDQAVNQPATYSCKRCGGVLVCGVDPQCVN